MREPQERERLRFPLAPRRPAPGGTPPELDQPGLTRVQLQPEPGEPAAQLIPEPLGVVPVLEPDDEVVRLCGLPDYAARPVFTLVTVLECAGRRHNRRAGQRVLR